MIKMHDTTEMADLDSDLWREHKAPAVVVAVTCWWLADPKIQRYCGSPGCL